MTYIQHFLNETYYFYNEMAIYLVFGFLVAGILHVFFPDSMVRRHLGKPGAMSMIKSTLFGIPLPLCSCGVIPVATSLRRSGATKGATVSFLISTPQIGADSFLLTYSLLGWVFAVFRVITSILTAIFAGLTLHIFDREQEVPEKDGVELKERQTAADRLRSLPTYVEYELFGSIANTLVAGILIAGLIGTLIPANFFEEYFNYPFLSMLIMLAVGIPMYVCAAASTPIAASLVLKGLNPGAALVFLLTGPATNAVNFSTVSSILGKKAMGLYLASISIVALAVGYLFNLLAAKVGLAAIVTHHQHELLAPWLKTLGVIVLSAMFASYYIKTKIINRKKGAIEVAQMSLDVQGMTCMHCAGNVQKAVEQVDGVSAVKVHLEEGKVNFEVDQDSKVEQIKKNIIAAGYEV